jgi:hypothetical protein
VLKVEAPEALHATEKHVVCIVDELWIDFLHWVDSIILFALALLL